LSGLPNNTCLEINGSSFEQLVKIKTLLKKIIPENNIRILFIIANPFQIVRKLVLNY